MEGEAAGTQEAMGSMLVERSRDKIVFMDSRGKALFVSKRLRRLDIRYEIRKADGTLIATIVQANGGTYQAAVYDSLNYLAGSIVEVEPGSSLNKGYIILSKSNDEIARTTGFPMNKNFVVTAAPDGKEVAKMVKHKPANIFESIAMFMRSTYMLENFGSTLDPVLLMAAVVIYINTLHKMGEVP